MISIVFLDDGSMRRGSGTGGAALACDGLCVVRPCPHVPHPHHPIREQARKTNIPAGPAFREQVLDEVEELRVGRHGARRPCVLLLWYVWWGGVERGFGGFCVGGWGGFLE